MKSIIEVRREDLREAIDAMAIAMAELNFIAGSLPDIERRSMFEQRERIARARSRLMDNMDPTPVPPR